MARDNCSDERLRSAYDLNRMHEITRRRNQDRPSRFYKVNDRTYDRLTGEPVSPYDLGTMHDLTEEIKNGR